MTRFGQTPSQTIGPFFHDALVRDGVDDIDPHGVAGTPILVHGIVRDGGADPVGDAMVEVWQPDGEGRFRHPADPRSGDVAGGFIGFGRVATAADGSYHLRTAMPGRIPAADGSTQAPHLNVHVFARGLLDLLFTRIYFADVDGTDDDRVLRGLPDDRRRSLLAQPDGAPDGVRRYRFDIVLQGRDETVFFDA